MSNFDKAITHVLEEEGLYNNDPDDCGNWTSGKINVGECKGTNYGISAASYPTLDIKNLTQQQAIDIYRRDYWKSYMEVLPEIVACKHFDMVVNMGQRQGVILLQRACGCDEDGKIGPITLASVKAHEPDELVNNLVTVQRAFYTSIAKRTPAMAKFLHGWLNRANWTPT